MSQVKNISLRCAEAVKWTLYRASSFLTPKRVLLYASALGVVSWGLILSFQIQLWRMDENPGRDFVAFYTAATLARVDPGKLYDSGAQIDLQKLWSRGALEGTHWQYLYPPFFTAAISPLGYFSYTSAYWVWSGLTIFLYLLSILFLSRSCSSTPVSFCLTLPVALAAPTLQWLVITGQTTAIGLFLWTFGFYLLKQRREFLSGLILGGLCYRAQYMALLVPLFLIKRVNFVLGGIGMACLILVIIGGIVFSFGSYLEYTSVLGDFSQRIVAELQPLSRHISLYGFFRSLLPNGLAVMLAISVSSILVYWVIKMWRGRLRLQSDAFDLQFALLVVSSLLLMHHALAYDLLLITIPAFLIYYHRSLFPPYYKLLLALIYFSPYILVFFGNPFRVNFIQPLLLWLCFEIYRAYEKVMRSTEKQRLEAGG